MRIEKTNCSILRAELNFRFNSKLKYVMYWLCLTINVNYFVVGPIATTKPLIYFDLQILQTPEIVGWVLN